jgi:zinc transporter 9
VAHSCKLPSVATCPNPHTDISRYVAMHSMSEATSGQSHDDSQVNGYMDAYPGNKSMSRTDIGIVLFGMLFPLVTQIGHAHAH